MLVVAEPDRVAEIQAVCAKWELGATPIGQVTDDGIFRVRHDGLRGRRDPGPAAGRRLPDLRPRCARERRGRARPARGSTQPRAEGRSRRRPATCCSTRPTSRASAGSTSSTTRPCRPPPCSAPAATRACSRCRAPSFGLAVTVDCNNRLVALDPYEGGKAAVAEAARNIACTGARPLGITDCLNFGNPEKPDVFFQFREACRGIADACRAFDTPVTGGNVSFYNESPTGAVDPTPTVGMVGLLERVADRVPSHFAAPGDEILILGATRGELGRLRLLGRGARLRRRPARAGGSRRRAPAAAAAGRRGPAPPAPLGARLLGGRPARGAGRGGHRRRLRAGRARRDAST